MKENKTPRNKYGQPHGNCIEYLNLSKVYLERNYINGVEVGYHLKISTDAHEIRTIKTFYIR